VSDSLNVKNDGHEESNNNHEFFQTFVAVAHPLLLIPPEFEVTLALPAE
jgi:hypothetical protein